MKVASLRMNLMLTFWVCLGVLSARSHEHITGVWIPTYSMICVVPLRAAHPRGLQLNAWVLLQFRVGFRVPERPTAWDSRAALNAKHNVPLCAPKYVLYN